MSEENSYQEEQDDVDNLIESMRIDSLDSFSMCTCPDSGMIVKQRHEIINLTKEVTRQTEQIGIILDRNGKLREKLKTNEKEKLDFESRVRSLLKEVNQLKGSKSLEKF